MSKPEINFSLIDLKGLSEPVCKLIDAVSSAVGILYEPTRMRKTAKAEADARLVIAHAQATVDDLAARAAERIANRELRRQRNIEAIVKGAIDHLPSQVDKDKPEPDWIAQFFNQCEDVGDATMQSLWSKLLAGEVAYPGTYSLRTIDLVNKLHTNDAKIFTQVCAYVWRVKAPSFEAYHYFTESEIWHFLSVKGVTFDNFLKLSALGLAEIGPLLNLVVRANTDTLFSYYNKEYAVRLNDDRTLPVFVLTDLGAELYPICGSIPDEQYRELVTNVLEKRGILLRPRTHGD